jgi:hypothetical protein
LVDIERAPEGETPAVNAGMRTLVEVVCGRHAARPTLRRGR